MAFKLLSRLPLGILYLLSSVTYFCVYYLARYRVTVTRTNLKNAFPELTADVRHQMERNYYQAFIDSLFETVKSYSISLSEMQTRVDFPSIGIIRDQLRHHPTVILLTAHLGNLEWLLMRTQLGLECPIDPVYRPAHNQLVDHFIFDTRSRLGATPIPYKKMARDLILRKDIRRAIAVPADLRPRRRERTVDITFLNQNTRFFSSAGRIAQKHGLPVILVTMQRKRRGYYSAHAQLISNGSGVCNENGLTAVYAQHIEHEIRQQPESWLWSHERWKS